MADPPAGSRGTGRRHLDITGDRAVVFCHLCDHEWYQDEHGLTCPACSGEASEIITDENDPRTFTPEPPPIRDLDHHNPWRDGISDPEEEDLDNFLHNNASGSGRTFWTSSSTSRGNSRRPTNGQAGPPNPSDVMRDFQSLLENMVGPTVRQDPPGRSGPETLFGGRNDPFGRAFPIFGGVTSTTSTGSGPGVIRHQHTFTFGGSPRGQNDANAAAEDLTTILSNIFGAMPPGFGDPNAQRASGQAGPPGLQGLFASLFGNGVSGDAVYTQEALDRIISGLMEQHPTSNAPGPASSEAIAKLPKKHIDKEMLGPELKAECSVCMDDVHLGDEVVQLPCRHWFHEFCATAWLSEHNTCPICRKSIDGNPQPTDARPSPNNADPTANTTFSNSPASPQRSRSVPRRSSRNEARLESIRDLRRVPSPPDPMSDRTPRRYHIVGNSSGNQGSDRLNRRTRSPSPTRDSMPGSFRTRDSRDERDGNGVSSGVLGSRVGSRRGNNNARGSDESRRSQRSGSGSGGSSGSRGEGGSGPLSWLKSRFGGGGSGSGDNGRRE